MVISWIYQGDLMCLSQEKQCEVIESLWDMIGYSIGFVTRSEDQFSMQCCHCEVHERICFFSTI